MKKSTWRIIVLSSVGWVGVVFIVMVWLAYQLRDLGHLTVRFFDVGQGDAALVTTPSGSHILVDGGPDNTLIHKIGRALPVWDREIELLVITHPHADHVVGLVELARRYRIRQALMPSAATQTPEYQALRAEFRRQGVREITMAGPVAQRLEAGVELRVLYPPTAQPPDDPNDASTVLQIAYGQHALLFTGDLSADAQAKLPPPWLGSDVLKVPHHGAADSLNPAVLAAVAPRLAVISVGKNSYGHPSPRVRKALERLGATVATTRDDGDVVVGSDERQLWFSTGRKPAHQQIFTRTP